MTFFKSLPPNDLGHDFVVGDLHGKRRQLLARLDALGFNPRRDRVFCTGDLIDRSPDSFDTLKLLHEPWFHFVRGNHDDDLPNFIDFEFSRFPGWRPAYCDQEWLYSLDSEQMEYLKTVLLPLLAAAPVVLRVEGERGFWMVHADRGEFARYANPIPLLPDTDLPGASGDPQLESLLWSRRLFKQIPARELEDRGLYQAVPHLELQTGVGLTFVGHSIVQQPILYRSHLFLDTGEASGGPGLTVLRVTDILNHKPSTALEKHRQSVPAIVAGCNCTNPRVFGSVLDGTDTFASDLDLLVDPLENTTLFHLGRLQHTLLNLLKVRVQVVTPGDLPEKWRQTVLDEARPV